MKKDKRNKRAKLKAKKARVEKSPSKGRSVCHLRPDGTIMSGSVKGLIKTGPSSVTTKFRNSLKTLDSARDKHMQVVSESDT